jgi:hypothetical protein
VTFVLRKTTTGRRFEAVEANPDAVRATSPPPLAPAKAFSRSGCGRIFPLFSRVMREGLSTGPAPGGPEAVSQGRYSPDLMTAPIW